MDSTNPLLKEYSSSIWAWVGVLAILACCYLRTRYRKSCLVLDQDDSLEFHGMEGFLVKKKLRPGEVSLWTLLSYGWTRWGKYWRRWIRRRRRGIHKVRDGLDLVWWLGHKLDCLQMKHEISWITRLLLMRIFVERVIMSKRCGMIQGIRV